MSNQLIINLLFPLSSKASSELYSKSIADRAEFYKKAYADMYDEIERGYADGTRKTYVVDNGVKRLATKEEELTDQACRQAWLLDV